MNQIFKKRVLAVSIALLMTPAVYATNGLAPTGLGQVHKAMGGAAAGNPENTTSMSTNPAAASFINDGYDVELELFKPNRTIYRKTLPAQMGGIPGKKYTANEKSVFFIPGGGYKKTINNKFSVGVAVYGNGGMNTEFKKGPTFISPGGPGYPPAGSEIPFSQKPGERSGINLEQLFIAPTLGVKLNDRHSLGISANLVYQRFEAKGLQSLAGGSADQAHFTSTGTSSATGIGATIGWMGKLSETTTVGASYRMKTKMGKFKKYAGLFPDHGRMDIPASLTVGISSQVTPKTKLAFDIQQIYYSDTHAIGNPSDKKDASGNPLPFGVKNGPGFGWDDQTVYKVGVKHQKTPRLALMAGYNHGGSPVGPEDTFFGSLAPGVVEDHLSLGFEYKLSKNSSLLGSYTHTFSNKVKGDLIKKRQPFDLEMDQDAVGIGYSKTF